MGKETVLALLLREKGRFVSGEAVSAELGITRAAIWKSISALRAQGYEVTGIACKCGTVNKTELGIPERCLEVGQNICNPVLQALVLNGEKTELNIALGLCVGHDSMFYKYSEAPVTTLSAKDRLLCHASLGPLYLLDGYWKRLLKPDPYLTAPQNKTEEGKTGDTSN